MNDSQVWKVIAGEVDKPESFVGLVVAYVDDLLLMFPSSSLRVAFNTALRALWTLSSEQVLDGSAPFVFLGLELQRLPNGDLLVHQGSFVRQLLTSYGLEVVLSPWAQSRILSPQSQMCRQMLDC